MNLHLLKNDFCKERRNQVNGWLSVTFSWGNHGLLILTSLRVLKRQLHTVNESRDELH
jgi:hypothetical protein